MMNSLPTSDISCKLIARENTPVVWLLVKDRIKRTLDEFGENEFTLEDVQADLLLGKRQLWLVNNRALDIKLVAITKIINYPRVRRLLIDIVVGEGVMETVHLIRDAELWMRQFGATQIEAHARPSLARLLERARVFKRQRVVLIRDSEDAYLSATSGKVE